MEKHITQRIILLGALVFIIIISLAIFTTRMIYEKEIIPEINNIHNIEIYEATILYNRFYIDVYNGKYNLTDEFIFTMEENLQGLEIELKEMKNKK